MSAYLETVAHWAYDMFSRYKYLSVNLVFPPRFRVGSFFLIAHFPDHCLLVPFYDLVLILNRYFKLPENFALFLYPSLPFFEAHFAEMYFLLERLVDLVVDFVSLLQ